MAGHSDIIYLLHRELEELDANVRTEEGPASTPLHLAAGRGHAQCVIALIECGAILNAVDRCWRRPLDVAIEHRHFHVVHVINMYGTSLLFVFVSCKFVTLVVNFVITKHILLFFIYTELMKAAEAENLSLLEEVCYHNLYLILMFFYSTFKMSVQISSYLRI